jgi:hypothetical protein
MTMKRRSSTQTSAADDSSSSNNNDHQQHATHKKQKRNNIMIKKSHWSRPGVDAAARLVSLPIITTDNNNKNVKSWNTALSHYEYILKSKGNCKNNTKLLYHLDQERQDIAQQWREEYYTTNKEKNEGEWGNKKMTKEELLNVIIPWKFLKGKPRNALKPLLQSNKDGDVIEASMLAFNFADSTVVAAAAADNNNDKNANNTFNHNVEEAIQSLCKLSGVGPATASAVLSAYCPQSFAFMDDEVIECLYEAKRGYTLKIYMAVNGRCVDIAKQLNEASSGGSSSSSSSEEENKKWTPADVAKALWTVATMSALKDEDCLRKVFADS